MADLPIPDLSTTEQRLQGIEHAITALRQGLPAAIAGDATAGLPPLVLIASETASELGLAAFQARISGTAVVVLAGCRAERVSGKASGAMAGFRPQLGEFDREALQALADPTRPQDYPPLDSVAPPPGTDAAIALAKLAGLLPAILVAPARTSDWGGAASVDRMDVLGHATLSAGTLTRVSEASVPLAGIPDCRVIAFRAPGTGQDHLAILIGRPEAVAEPLVRVHSECLTGDLLGSMRCDCGDQLHGAIERIAAQGSGAVLYLAQEGRGIGLANKLRAYTLQDRGLDTLDANRALGFAGDERDFQVAAAMLRQLGLTRVRLLTNNPAKLASLGQHGIEVTARVSLLFAANGVNDSYLATKARRFGHMLGSGDET
jgi:GTP cyclohydrolase II